MKIHNKHALQLFDAIPCHFSGLSVAVDDLAVLRLPQVNSVICILEKAPIFFTRFLQCFLPLLVRFMHAKRRDAVGNVSRKLLQKRDLISVKRIWFRCIDIESSLDLFSDDQWERHG
jgi:hypothetical protein